MLGWILDEIFKRVQFIYIINNSVWWQMWLIPGYWLNWIEIDWFVTNFKLFRLFISLKWAYLHGVSHNLSKNGCCYNQFIKTPTKNVISQKKWNKTQQLSLRFSFTTVWQSLHRTGSLTFLQTSFTSTH